MDAILAQAFGCRDLRRDDPFRIARATAVDACGVF